MLELLVKFHLLTMETTMMPVSTSTMAVYLGATQISAPKAGKIAICPVALIKPVGKHDLKSD